eukprot:snap_masked-scaffold_55-processed-gene-1.19-mRNA-1 protein AED:1.00 eAED:1.00 QI:0/-1/0/0/-1/1/1/0/357
MCLELEVGRTCGLHGFCDTELNKCICDEGWSQSFEMIYFPFTKDNIKANETQLFDRLPCNSNKTLLFNLFLLSFISSTIALLYNLPFLTTKRRFLRQLPLLLSFLAFALCSLVRVIDINRIYEEDKFYTFSLAIAIFLQNTGTVVFVSKYISYHLKKLKKAFGTDLKVLGVRMTPVLRKTIPAFLTLDILLLPIFILPAYVDKATAGYLFYVENMVQSLRCILFALLTYVTSRGIIRDMQVIVKSNQDESKKASSFYLYCKAAIPNLRLVVYIVLGYSFAFGQSMFLYSIFEFQELIHKYYWAISGFGWAFMSSVITYALIKNLKLARTLKTNTQNRPKFKTSTLGPTSGVPRSTSI